jgi:broad specificity phosphatase PhoE
MQVILVRHGETASNRDRLALGREDVALTDKGQIQAQMLAARLTEDSAQGLRIDAIYSSPLLRARQTAGAIADTLGLVPKVVPSMIEMDVGQMEGLTREQLRSKHPEFMAAWFGEGAGEVPMPGGESLAGVQERAWAAIEQLRDRHAEDAAVIAVSHNFVIRTLVCRALGLPLYDFRRFEIDLASMTRIEFRGPRTLVTVMNETCHLE